MTGPTSLGELSEFPHVLQRVAFDGGYGDDTEPEQVEDVAIANGLSSEIASGLFAGQHTLAIDLDVPARLVPSSTPGHSHLYIDTPMQWADYLAVLNALANVGVIEPGYLAASARCGYTTLRLPWVRKGHDPISLDKRLICAGCRKHPSQITEYDSYAETEGVTNAEYVWQEEGTLNRGSHLFYCDACYIKAGQPLGTAP